MSQAFDRRYARACRAAPIIILALTLCACTTSATPSNAPPTIPSVVAVLAPTTAAVPTTVPSVAPPTIAPTVAPTVPTLPTVAPTVAIPVESDAPGPGWVFALTSDANQDGVADAVFYWPAAVAPDVQFEAPERAAVAVAAEQIVVVQRSAAGLETLLRIDRDGGWADQLLFDFAGRRAPAGYLLALDPARGPLVNLLPYGAGGVGYEPIGIEWERDASGFRMVGERP